MKKNKKDAKSTPPRAAKKAPKTEKESDKDELSTEELENVTGGAVTLMTKCATGKHFPEGTL